MTNKCIHDYTLLGPTRPSARHLADDQKTLNSFPGVRNVTALEEMTARLPEPENPTEHAADVRRRMSQQRNQDTAVVDRADERGKAAQVRHVVSRACSDKLRQRKAEGENMGRERQEAGVQTCHAGDAVYGAEPEQTDALKNGS